MGRRVHAEPLRSSSFSGDIEMRWRRDFGLVRRVVHEASQRAGIEPEGLGKKFSGLGECGTHFRFGNRSQGKDSGSGLLKAFGGTADFAAQVAVKFCFS
jgi:hypothetical protein